ncbi:hypothetical protein [Bradyrhizobium sacchari]|uniref:Uncharacterized protein n=1 Tax=Bradyrhizobium sacchari TaxID=1399419 RepID=A0A560J6J3_9BRAD|nr:hypothetical protein FBZ94_101513 [Bradyrhizobium sacchari]TWB84070.1 hypothetical protein FBZ95_101513 [Bradyrhizobium sacchari]
MRPIMNAIQLVAGLLGIALAGVPAAAQTYAPRYSRLHRGLHHRRQQYRFW